jgi:Homeodomain-like domain-containing protein
LVISSAVVVSHEQLNRTYKKETESDVKERILLVRRVRFDGIDASKVAEKELNRTRWWAYKWLKRFDKEGLEGLKRPTKKWQTSKDIRKKDGKDKTKGHGKPIGMGGQTGYGFDI